MADLNQVSNAEVSSSFNGRALWNQAERMLAHDYPFHGAMLSSWNVIVNTSIRTMAIMLSEDQTIEVHFNPEFILSLSPREIVAVQLHEIHHVVLGHVFCKPSDFSNKVAFYVSAEICANEYIREPLPGCPILLSDFRKLKPDQSLRERYECLKEINLEKYSDIITLDEFSLETCDLETLKFLISSHIESALTNVGLKGLQSLPESFRKSLEELFGDTIRSGISASNAIEQVSSRSGKRKNWRKELQLFAYSLVDPSACMSRPPRRIRHLVGIIPGTRSFPKKPKIMAVIDTSGSVSQEMFSSIINELNGIRKIAEVILVQCDDQVQSAKILKDKEKVETLTGRGGTDLRPPFEKDFLKAHKPDAIVYFTDGFGQGPDKRPKFPVLWALIGIDAQKPVLWGKVISLNQDNASTD